MENIIEGINNCRKIAHNLHEVKLLSRDEVRIILTTLPNYQPVMITKLVAGVIHNGDKEAYFRFTKFMKTHWALTFLLQYWQKMCKYCPSYYTES